MIHQPRCYNIKTNDEACKACRASLTYVAIAIAYCLGAEPGPVTVCEVETQYRKRGGEAAGQKISRTWQPSKVHLRRKVATIALFACGNRACLSPVELLPASPTTCDMHACVVSIRHIDRPRYVGLLLSQFSGSSLQPNLFLSGRGPLRRL